MSCQRYVLHDFLQRFMDKPDECELFKLLERLPKPSPCGPWIAGGAIRRTLTDQPLDSDIDYFFFDDRQRADFATAILQIGSQIRQTQDVTTYSVQVEKRSVLVQAISMGHYQRIEDVLDSFDFTITQFGYDGKDLVCGEFALWDLARKRLALHKLTHGVSTVRRLIKYARQGYTACGGAIASILQEVIAHPDVAHSNVLYID